MNNTALSAEDMQLLLQHTDTILLEQGAELPFTALPDTEILTCTASGDLVPNIYRLQPEHRLLVVTCTAVAKDLTAVLNRSFTRNHIAVCSSGTWDAAQALEEIRSSAAALTDVAGNPVILAGEPVGGIYFTDTGRIAAKQGIWLPCTGETLLCDGREWGTLLPESYSESSCMGRLSDFAGSLQERITILAALTAQAKTHADGSLPKLESVLLFAKGRALAGTWEQPEDPEAGFSAYAFVVLFGEPLAECRDVTGTIANSLAAEKTLVPGAFVNDLEQMYLLGRRYSLKKWSNILTRVLTDYAEDAKRRGGDAR